ncbi:MAG: TIGR00366 family protein [Myxococcota bacterium]
MLAKLGDRLNRIAYRFVPDPFVLAVTLTVAVVTAGLASTGFGLERVARAWIDGSGDGRGFWNFLAFGMQMCLILVTGHALAASPPVDRLLGRLAALPRTPAGAISVVVLSAMTLSLINWGLGLIGGALLARRVGVEASKHEIPVDYRVLVAGAYCSMLVWHAGLSGSAPTKVTLESDQVALLGPELGAKIGAIPLSETIGAPANLVVLIALAALVPWLLHAAQRGQQATSSVNLPTDDGSAPIDRAPPSDDSPAIRFGRSPVLKWSLVGFGLFAAVSWLGRRGLDRLDPDLINFVFLFVGIAAYRTLSDYAQAVSVATRGCAGIILQFPFYAGIAGLLDGLNLIEAATARVVDLGAAALPAVAFYLAGAVNLVVPSGGGQWGVQGPLFMQAAIDAGVEPARMVMALAYGDQWTNMLQPFWALPLLATTGVRARDILGYTALILIVSQLVFLAGLYFI